MGRNPISAGKDGLLTRRTSDLVALLSILSALALGATVQGSVTQTNFNAGELSPQMEGRSDSGARLASDGGPGTGEAERGAAYDLGWAVQ